jgi:hypothetical protein
VRTEDPPRLSDEILMMLTPPLPVIVIELVMAPNVWVGV